jgi:hypothetical protein
VTFPFLSINPEKVIQKSYNAQGLDVFPSTRKTRGQRSAAHRNQHPGEFPATKNFLFVPPADKSRGSPSSAVLSFLCLEMILDSANFGHDAMRTPVFPGTRPGVSCCVLERL